MNTNMLPKSVTLSVVEELGTSTDINLNAETDYIFRNFHPGTNINQ